MLWHETALSECNLEVSRGGSHILGVIPTHCWQTPSQGKAEMAAAAENRTLDAFLLRWFGASVSEECS